MLFPDLGDALIHLTEKASRTTWVNGLPTMPTAAYLVAESISPTTGPGREGKKAQDLEPVRQRMVCAMMCGVAPSQPTYETSADA